MPLDQKPPLSSCQPPEFFFRSSRPVNPRRDEGPLAGSKAKVKPFSGLAHKTISGMQGLDPSLGGIGKYQLNPRSDGIPGAFLLWGALQPQGDPVRLF